MFIAKSIQAEHKDLIHDVAYDFHGRRMATCSSDQHVKSYHVRCQGDHSIQLTFFNGGIFAKAIHLIELWNKIWDLVDGEWRCSARYKVHMGSVWRVNWAHPEFGQVIATCSFDRTTAVWEELPGDAGEKGQWVKRGNLVDSRTSVTDVEFAPKHLGLQLATCSADGVVRIYEAPDVMNLSQWTLQHDIPCKLSCSCVSWNPSRVHPPMIAVGSDDSNPSAGGKVHIFEYNDNTRKWLKAETIMTVTDAVRDVAFAPNLGRSYHLLAIASKNVTIVTLKPLLNKKDISATSCTKFEIRQVAQFEDHQSQVWRLSWNVTGTILASSGDDGCVRLWKANYLGNWICISVLKGDGSAPQQSLMDKSNKNSMGSSSGTSADNNSGGARNLIAKKRLSIPGGASVV